MRTTDKVLLTVFSICLVVVASSLTPPHPFADLIKSLPWLWEVAFGIAAATTLLWIAFPYSKELYIASGVSVVIATASRACALLFIAGDLIATAKWVAVGVLALALWVQIRESIYLDRDEGR